MNRPHALRDGWALDALVSAGLLSGADAQAIRREAAEWVVQAAVARGAPEAAVRDVVARAARVAVADLSHLQESTLRFVPEALARRHMLLPMFASNTVIRIAAANPLDHDAEQAIRFVANRDVEFSYALPADLHDRIEALFPTTAGGRPTRTSPAPESPLVLVADDDAGTRLLVRKALVAEGFRAIEAVDGVAALEAIEQSRPDLLLLDMMMPRMDGFGVLDALGPRAGGQGLPIVVFTSSDDPDMERRCLEKGADDFVVKPVLGRTLVSRVRAVLRRASGG